MVRVKWKSIFEYLRNAQIQNNSYSPSTIPSSFDTFYSCPWLCKRKANAMILLCGCAAKKHFPLRKHAYSNILKILPPKNENFQIKTLIFFIFLLKTDCGYSLEPPRRGGSNEFPQSIFLSRNKKNNVYPCKPQFYSIKWGLRGSTLYRHVFVMARHGSVIMFISVFTLQGCHKRFVM